MCERCNEVLKEIAQAIEDIVSFPDRPCSSCGDKAKVMTFSPKNGVQCLECAEMHHNAAVNAERLKNGELVAGEAKDHA